MSASSDEIPLSLSLPRPLQASLYNILIIIYYLYIYIYTVYSIQYIHSMCLRDVYHILWSQPTRRSSFAAEKSAQRLSSKKFFKGVPEAMDLKNRRGSKRCASENDAETLKNLCLLKSPIVRNSIWGETCWNKHMWVELNPKTSRVYSYTVWPKW